VVVDVDVENGVGGAVNAECIRTAACRFTSFSSKFVDVSNTNRV
jgi:hypothetical protein